MKLFGLRLTGRRKGYFLIFAFSFFFQISNGNCQKSYNGFGGFLVISTTSEIFLICTFLTMKQRPFEFFFV